MDNRQSGGSDNTYDPLQTSAGSSYIPFPIRLRSKHHTDRVNEYKEYEPSLNLTGITFSIKARAIPRFAKQNEISDNVFGYEKNEVPHTHHTIDLKDT